MSIQYLNTSTQMKIRPVSDEDVLFEMETNEFMTTCCRVDTSYDLVVRDITSGAMLFCISGAEIEDHPLDVYISDNHHIGRINGMNIYVHGQNNQTVRIQRIETQYMIQGCTVTTAAGLVTLNWSTDFSVELKALSIAFALNIAMTKHKGTVIDRADIRPTTPVEVRYPSLLPSTQSEACPRNNRCTAPCIFELSDCKQEFWLKESGRQSMHKKNAAFLMNKANKNVVKHIKSIFYREPRSFQILGADGAEELLATQVEKGTERHLTTFHLTFKEQIIGRFTFNSDTNTYQIMYSEEGTMKEISTRNVRRSGIFIKMFLDANNKCYGLLDEFFHTALDITLTAGISSNIKKAIISVSIFHFGCWMRMFNHLPYVRISKITCNCDSCLQPINMPRHLVLVNQLTYSTNVLDIRSAGHSKTKNLTYFNIFPSNGGKIYFTLEVTPIKDFQGIAKIEGKNEYGSIVFTSLHYQRENIFTIYDGNNRLVAYVVGMKVFDRNKDHILSVRKDSTGRNLIIKKFGPNVHFLIHDLQRKTVSIIGSEVCRVNVYRPMVSADLTQLFIELTLAIKFNSDPYKFDKIPTPEIAYCYRKPSNEAEKTEELV